MTCLLHTCITCILPQLLDGHPCQSGLQLQHCHTMLVTNAPMCLCRCLLVCSTSPGFGMLLERCGRATAKIIPEGWLTAQLLQVSAHRHSIVEQEHLHRWQSSLQRVGRPMQCLHCRPPEQLGRLTCKADASMKAWQSSGKRSADGVKLCSERGNWLLWPNNLPRC